MCAVKAQVLRRNNVWTEWIAFFAQVIIAISFEVGDDLGRGLFSQHGTLQGIRNARDVVSFETAHGFWIEPAWQLFFLHTRHIFALTISWLEIARAMNGVYVLGHVFITLGFAAWVYAYRRRYFVVLRNVIILTNAFALVIYENFPVAPPRLTSGLTFNHHSFTFQDTVFGVVSNGSRMVGTQVGYNEFSAMPSVHVAWALVVGAAVVWLARPLAIRVLGVVYPMIMLVAVVVTGNHFLMDAMAAVLVVALAAAVSFALYSLARTREWPRLVRLAVAGEG